MQAIAHALAIAMGLGEPGHVASNGTKASTTRSTRRRLGVPRRPRGRRRSSRCATQSPMRRMPSGPPVRRAVELGEHDDADHAKVPTEQRAFATAHGPARDGSDGIGVRMYARTGSVRSDRPPTELGAAERRRCEDVASYTARRAGSLSTRYASLIVGHRVEPHRCRHRARSGCCSRASCRYASRISRSDAIVRHPE